MKIKVRKFMMRLFVCLYGMVLFLSGISFAGDFGGTENYVDNFDDALSRSTITLRSTNKMDGSLVTVSKSQTAWNIVDKIIDVFFSVMVVVGVLVAMVGLYEVLTSSDEGKVKTGAMTLLYGVLGIILMYSAKYLTGIVFSSLFHGDTGSAISNVDLVKNIYDQIMFPFIKIAMYLSLGFLVIMMMIRVFTYITSQDEGTKKKSLRVIVWTTIGMIFIIGAKQVVEAVYGKQDTVIRSGASWSNLSRIGTRFLDPEDIPIVFNVINWALGLVSFVLLVMIILQTYKLLTKPDDAATFTSLKKTLIYALAGLLLIGSAYLLANLFIIG